MLIDALGLIAGLVALFLGGEWLVKGAARFARSLGVSPTIIGLTIVAIGTSMPELLVSVGAAISGSSDLSIGNIVGSNIANIGLILGLAALIYPISVHVTLVRREIPIMILTALLAYFLFRDGVISARNGIVLLAGLVAFISFMVYSARRQRRENNNQLSLEDELEIQAIKRSREIIRMIAGIVVLMVGAQLTVNNAVGLARALGISELVIGITLIAFGTSLPELVTTLVGALRKQSDLALGNVVGSNIINVLAVLGMTAVVRPIQVSDQIVNFDGLVMLGFSVLLLPFVANRRLSRWEAGLFVIAYLVYVTVLFTLAR
ncbi:MAG: calcium/sodium antiporter [Aggregatilineales bacterium]